MQKKKQFGPTTSLDVLLGIFMVACVHLDAVHAAGQHVRRAKAVEPERVLWFREPFLQDQQECDP